VHASPDQHSAQEDGDRDDRGRHEKEHELLSTQLNLVEGILAGVV
jgi:hypothetical protein